MSGKYFLGLRNQRFGFLYGRSSALLRLDRSFLSTTDAVLDGAWQAGTVLLYYPMQSRFYLCFDVLGRNRDRVSSEKVARY